jgi:hypothetical protein
METIECAAIKHRGKIYMLPLPANHEDIRRSMVKLGIRSSFLSIEGFMTSKKRFVRRKEAGDIAIDASQCNRLLDFPRLSSEDLWKV